MKTSSIFSMNENMATLSPWAILIDKFMENMANHHGKPRSNRVFMAIPRRNLSDNIWNTINQHSKGWKTEKSCSVCHGLRKIIAMMLHSRIPKPPRFMRHSDANE